jgi:predicted nucleotidyltransferase
MNVIKSHISELNAVCKQYGVKSLFVFGSVANDSETAESDVDLLVEFYTEDPLVYADNYFGLKFSLHDILKRNIDLLEAKVLKNPFLKEQINSTKVLVYG